MQFGRKILRNFQRIFIIAKFFYCLFVRTKAFDVAKNTTYSKLIRYAFAGDDMLETTKKIPRIPRTSLETMMWD